MPLRITVQVSSNSSHAFDVDKTTTISVLKTLVHIRTGIPLDKIRLIYSGVRLDPEKTIKHYDIDETNVIDLFVLI